MEQPIKKKSSPLTLTEITYNRMIKLLWSWKCRNEDTALERATSNVKFVFNSLMQMKWQKRRDHNRDLDQMILYIQQLTPYLLDQLFTRFVCSEDEVAQSKGLPSIVQAGHIALFVHQQTRQLKLRFTNKRFDLDKLLEICGHRMQNLEDFQLPINSTLSTNASMRLCEMVPNLKKLNLLSVKVGDDIITQVAKMSLQELNISSISDRGIMKLCSEKSNCKFTLQVLEIMTYKVSQESHMLLLKSMPSLECLHSLNFRLAALPIEFRQEPFNLRELKYFDGSSMNIEKELEIAIYMCPALNRLAFERGVMHFTPRILLLWTKFEYLSALSIEGQQLDNLFVIEMRWALPGLVDLRVGYIGSDFSSGHFFTLLNMCPNLEILRVTGCEGFNDRVAIQTAQHLSDKNIVMLKFTFCDLLRPTGIGALLKIPNLRKCIIKYGNLKLEDIDDEELKDLHTIAVECSVKLEIRLKKSVVVVLVE